MMKPQNLGLTLLCLMALCACSTVPTVKTEILYKKLQCPVPPACDDSRRAIATNADLANELVRTRANLAVCKIRGDTLQNCIDSQP